MRTLFLLLSISIGITVIAQERCVTADYSLAQKIAGTIATTTIAEAESFIQNEATSIHGRTSGNNTIIKIPVVVHVLYKDASRAVSDAQIRSQIAVLNKDFRRKNSDAVNTPERFQSIAADVEIEFYLATADPKGRATTGIVRRQTSIANFVTNDRIKFSSQGGDDAWDSKSYLNIWVGNLVAGAGYSSMPGSDEAKDGIVISQASFGVISGGGNYSGGRTATHEVGHWLGLKHIWGDASCGDDGVYDTPQQAGYTQGCPTTFRSTCDNGLTGDMYMNFMDYTNDACMNLFTLGQKQRMHAVFADGGPRAALLQSKGLQQPWFQEPVVAEMLPKVRIYPNPAFSEINIVLNEVAKGKTVSIFNANGSLVQTIQLNSGSQKINISAFSRGLYFIKGEGFTEKFNKL
jgi:hypothetical protein